MLNKLIALTGFFLLTLILSISTNAQKPTIDQLKDRLSRSQKNDTTRVNLLNELGRRTEISPGFRDSLVNESINLSRKLSFLPGESFALNIKAQFGDIAQSIDLSKQSIALAEKSGNKKSLFWAYRSLGQSMLNTSENVNAIDPFQKALDIAMEVKDPTLIVAGQTALVDYYRGVATNYPVALEWGFKALKTAEQYHDTMDLPNVYRNIGSVYLLLGEKEKSLETLQKAVIASRQIGDYETAQYALNDMGEQYRIKGMYPEALKAYGEAALLIKDSFNIELNQSNVADVYQRMGNDALCFEYAFKSLAGAKSLKDTIGIAWINNILSRACLHTGKTDSAIFYANEGYQYAVKTQVPEFIRDNSEALSNAYHSKHDFEKSFFYYKIFISSRDSILNNEISNKAHLAQYNYDIEKKQAEIATLNKDKELQESKVERQRLLLIGAVSILLLILVSLIILSRNISKRKKAYALLHEQKQEIQVQRDQTNQALNDLKLAQTQLIQSEKMASLGELTAGIAHEIQNPLNFVNNFSEVSAELIKEMVEEVNKGNTSEVKSIANDVVQNLEKIIHHGKRADGIVKGMLQHSRSSSSTKELTDINDLADEYLRLSYHGLRAKDKSFNASMKTDFDMSIEEINIVPQDVGRVILNLLTNAFYAVNEKALSAVSTPTAAKYEPTVSVSTKKIDNKIQIKVADNGNGIPQKVLDKIFQPFFTTKPTGQGTGLGLSLSYDIITKGHGGQLKVETKEGEGTTFIIELN